MRDHIRYILISLTLILPATAIGQPRPPIIHSEGPLLSFRSALDGKVGYIDASGKIVIAPRFSGEEAYNEIEDSFREFSEGFAGILTGSDKYSFIDERGNLITALEFDGIGSFSEGLALVKLNNKLGFIDVAGKIALPLEFDDADQFSEGLAPACITFGKCGYIDTTGRFVFEPAYEVAEVFSEGLAAVRINGKYGYIDKTGKIVIEPQFGSADYFNEGLALVGKPEDENEGTWPEGYINRKGKLVINTRFKGFRGMESFSEGLAVIESKKVKDLRSGIHKSGYINRRGQIVIAPRYEFAGSFSEGLAPVGHSRADGAHGRYGYIDKTGRVLIKLKFNAAGNFNEGIAWVELYSPPDRRSHSDSDSNRVTEAYINRRGKVFFKGRWVYATAASGNGDDEEPALISVTIDSTPQGAKVFLVPLVDLDDDPNLLNSAKLDNYRTGTDTVFKNKVYEQVYRVVVELKGKREIRPLDVHSDKDNTVIVNFNPPPPDKKSQPAPGKRRRTRASNRRA